MEKYKIGYTTGVFDLFHIGHLNILKKSKELCDYLIVGVSVDNLVESYKNIKPIIPYYERSQIIEAIRYVDKVVPQFTLDKLEAHNRLKFNVLFQGDDWKNTPWCKEHILELYENNIDVVLFPYTRSTSSTMIRSILKRKNPGK